MRAARHNERGRPGRPAPGTHRDRHPARLLGRRAAAVLLAGLALAAGGAGAGIPLRLEPAEQHLAVGAHGQVAVVLDEPLELRTLEIWVRYRADICGSDAGDPGFVFSGTGCPLFPAFDDVVDGEWYAGVVTLGPDCWATGPGELFRWEFDALADGICPVAVDSVKLYDPQALRIPDVTITHASILVGTATAVGPPAAPTLGLRLAPNPFNPRTELRLSGRPGERASLEVFDAAGRLVARPWKGLLETDGARAYWDGRDREGRPAPAGIYLFRLRGEGGRRTVARGVLLD